jgi:hypothetical protein
MLERYSITKFEQNAIFRDMWSATLILCLFNSQSFDLVLELCNERIQKLS